jgi:hypothetical protein
VTIRNLKFIDKLSNRWTFEIQPMEAMGEAIPDLANQINIVVDVRVNPAETICGKNLGREGGERPVEKSPARIRVAFRKQGSELAFKQLLDPRAGQNRRSPIRFRLQLIEEA